MIFNQIDYLDDDDCYNLLMELRLLHPIDLSETAFNLRTRRTCNNGGRDREDVLDSNRRYSTDVRTPNDIDVLYRNAKSVATTAR
jgi:hypothetical protein